MQSSSDTGGGPRDPAIVVGELAPAATAGTIGEPDAALFLDAVQAALGGEQALAWAGHFVGQHPDWHRARFRLGSLLVASGDAAGRAHIDYALAADPTLALSQVDAPTPVAPLVIAELQMEGVNANAAPGAPPRAASRRWAPPAVVAAHPRFAGVALLVVLVLGAVVMALATRSPAKLAATPSAGLAQSPTVTTPPVTSPAKLIGDTPVPAPDAEAGASFDDAPASGNKKPVPPAPKARKSATNREEPSGPPSTTAVYVARIKALKAEGGDLESMGPDSTPEQIRASAADLRGLIEQLRAINPPAVIFADHQKLVGQLGQVASGLEKFASGPKNEDASMELFWTFLGPAATMDSIERKLGVDLGSR